MQHKWQDNVQAYRSGHKRIVQLLQASCSLHCANHYRKQTPSPVHVQRVLQLLSQCPNLGALLQQLPAKAGNLESGGAAAAMQQACQDSARMRHIEADVPSNMKVPAGVAMLEFFITPAAWHRTRYVVQAG
jgi:hypothetical protein